MNDHLTIMNMLRLTLSFVWCCGLGQANAMDLLADFGKAVTYDPTYQTALAEFKGNEAAAVQSYAAYTPSGSYNNQRIQTDISNRTTFTISQPLLDYGALSTFRQAEPKRGFAEATLVLKQQDLALRLLKAANAIVLANENIKLNHSKIVALEHQFEAAKKKLELGQGTITDQRDIEVKAAQARSAQIGYKNQLITAVKQYAAITGETPRVQDFVLPEKHNAVAIRPLQEYLDKAMQNGATIWAAKYSERIAELDVDKATSSLLPTFSASYTDTKSSGFTNRYTGVVMNLPLGASTIFARQGVQANHLKAKEATRDAQEKAKVEVDRLRSLIETTFEALSIQRDAIKAAELSVQANEKSYEGGVRSAVDVLNAAQTVFQVKSDYVTAVTTQAENLMNIHNLTHPNPTDALQAISDFLLAVDRSLRP
jgi:protease secretion system outer membrane protein